jgi:hypothetical protein
MTDSNTSAPGGGDSLSSGSEFSKPTGVNDEALWEKHFGKGAKTDSGSKSSSEKKTGESERGARSDKSDDKPAKSAKPRGDSSKSTNDESKPSSGAWEKDSAEREPSKPKESKSKDEKTDSSKPEPKGKAEKADKDSDKDDAPADPEAPSKKARDLYDAAKKADDPKEARKLYKRAMKEAFGEVPAEFDDSQYAAVRRERKAAKAALDAQASKNEGRIKEAAEKLRPAIYVMRQLEGAGIHDKLTVPMVERAVSVMKALRSIEDGDYTQLAEVVSRAAGVDHDEAMKRFVRGVKVSPEGKAARQAAEQAQREAQALKERLAAMERQLQERDSQQTEAQKKAEREKQVAEHRQSYLEQIETDLEGHPVLKLPRGRERVLAYLIRTADPKLRAPTLSFEQAANRIVAAEKRRLQEARALEDDAPPAIREQPRRLTDVSRSETVESGLRKESAEQVFDRLWDKHAGGRRR